MKIGIIGGAGRMGRLYSKSFLERGHEILISDIDKIALKEYPKMSVQICGDNKELARKSDIVIYSVPIADTPEIIKESAQYLHEDATVGGFTSTKTNEVNALKKYAPADNEIITFHPMHGPSLDPAGQRFIIVPIREKKEGSRKKQIEELVKSLGSRISYLSTAEEHDKIMADTQALTHFTFLSMGYAWKMLGFHPKDHPTYQNEVDKIKSLQTLRILSQNPEVYAGIAIYNPEVKPQVTQYTKSLDEIMKLIIRGDKIRLLQLWDDVVTFLGKEELKSSDKSLSNIFEKEYVEESQTNSHLSLIAMGSAWKELGIKPKDNVAFQTPPYKIRSLLVHKILNGNAKQYIDNAIDNSETKVQDYYFCKSVTTFDEIIQSGNYKGFVKLFEEIAKFFGENELKKAKSETDDLIKKLIN